MGQRPKELVDYLYDEMDLLEQTENMRYDARLEAMGMQKIVHLMGMGYPVITKRKRKKEEGILNLLRVPEQSFYGWLRKLPQEQQELFREADQIQRNRRKSDLIDSIEDAADEFEELIVESRKSPRRDLPEEAKMLEKQAKVYTSLLNQLNQIEKNEGKSGLPEAPTGTGEYHVHVHTSDSQLERLRQLRQEKDNDKVRGD
jgi:hypothetical protein